MRPCSAGSIDNSALQESNAPRLKSCDSKLKRCNLSMSAAKRMIWLVRISLPDFLTQGLAVRETYGGLDQFLIIGPGADLQGCSLQPGLPLWGCQRSCPANERLLHGVHSHAAALLAQ